MHIVYFLSCALYPSIADDCVLEKNVRSAVLSSLTKYNRKVIVIARDDF